MTREDEEPARACYHIFLMPGVTKTSTVWLTTSPQDHVHQISRFPDLEEVVVVVVEERPSPDPNPTLQREGVP
ncbi:unnamed protein product [Boreogadus saida]